MHARAYISILAVVPFFIPCCTIRRFPVVRPVIEQSRNVYARAKAQEHFIRARDYERRGFSDMAEREYEKALQLDPESNLLKRQLVRCYVQSGKYTQALLLVKQGRKNHALSSDEKRIVSTIYLKMGEIAQAAAVLETIEKKTDEELYSLGLIYESLGNLEKALFNYYRCYQQKPAAIHVGLKVGRMMLQEKKYAQADDFLVEMQKKSGLLADIYRLRASVAIEGGDTAGGVAFFDSALAIDSLHEGTLRSKAQYHLGRNDFPPAIECYEKLVGSNPAGEVYRRTLALLYFYNDQFAESEKLLKTMLESSMDDYELHYLLGLVFSGIGNADLARMEFEKSLALQPENKEAWYELCRMLIRKKSYREAADIADRFTQILPHEAIAWRTRGQIESLNKNYHEAVASLKKAVALDSLDMYSWFELGSALERNRDFDRSAKAFRKVLKLRPGDPATLNYLGYMWAERGKNLDTAKQFLEQALRQEPHNGAFLDSYAWIFYQLGNYDSAFAYLQKATERIYDDPVLFHHLGDVLVKRNELKGAMNAYYRSLEFNADDSAVIRKKIVDLEIVLQHKRRNAQ
ncbi:MAG: tetratricopeptide repeat protein [Chitinispirillaceae bacterium]|nr:tetratricopeptide repeat protein [Chitinispirillaceae bacterium]